MCSWKGCKISAPLVTPVVFLTLHIRWYIMKEERRIGLWLWQTDRDEMSILYRGPAIDASYQVSIHLAKRFQRRRFKKICQSETRIACGGHVCYYSFCPDLLINMATTDDSCFWLADFYTPVFKTGRIMVYHYPSVRSFYMLRSNLRTPWPIHFKFHRVIGIDGLMV
jgi:hypothetical protein